MLQLGAQDAAAAQYAPLQYSSAGPFPLPAIAPRPSPQDHHVLPGSTDEMAGYGAQGEVYHPYGFPYGNQHYPPTQTTIRTQRDLQGLWSPGKESPTAEPRANYSAMSTASAAVQNPSGGGGDSGVDMSFPGRVSAPGLSTLTDAYASHPNSGGSLGVAGPGSNVSESVSLPMTFKRESFHYPNQWHDPARDRHQSVHVPSYPTHLDHDPSPGAVINTITYDAQGNPSNIRGM